MFEQGIDQIVQVVEAELHKICYFVEGDFGIVENYPTNLHYFGSGSD